MSIVTDINPPSDCEPGDEHCDVCVYNQTEECGVVECVYGIMSLDDIQERNRRERNYMVAESYRW